MAVVYEKPKALSDAFLTEIKEGGAGTYNKTEVLFACEGEEFHENISH